MQGQRFASALYGKHIHKFVSQAGSMYDEVEDHNQAYDSLYPDLVCCSELCAGGAQGQSGSEQGQTRAQGNKDSRNAQNYGQNAPRSRAVSFSRCMHMTSQRLPCPVLCVCVCVHRKGENGIIYKELQRAPLKPGSRWTSA